MRLLKQKELHGKKYLRRFKMIRFECISKALVKAISDFEVEYADHQHMGYQKNLGIVRKDKTSNGCIFWIDLSCFEFIEKFCYYFNQSVRGTCQCGELAILNEDGSSNSDVPYCGGGLTGMKPKKIWYNGIIGEYESIEAGIKHVNFNKALENYKGV